MANNIFLTGEPRVGKTTIITRLVKKLKLNPGGFMVGRKGKMPYYTGFYIAPAQYYILNKYNNNKAEKEGLFFACRKDCSSPWQVNNDILNEKGVSFLGQDTDLIIMDELGHFEIKAENFKRKIVQILDDAEKSVLGVIKNESNPFLDKIRNRGDIKIFFVNKHNQEEIAGAVYKEISNYLLQDSIYIDNL